MPKHKKRTAATGVLSALVVAAVPAFAIVGGSLAPSSAATAEVATLVATRDTGSTGPWSPTSPDPSGISYNPTTDRLIISDGEVDEMPLYAGANIYRATRAGGLVGTATTLPWSNEPTDVAFNPTTGQTYYTDDDKKSLFVQPAAGGTPTSFKTSTFGLTDPEGVAYDAVHNMVWMSEGVGADVYGLAPGPNGVFNGVPPTGDDVVAAQFDIGKYGSMEAEGIEYDAVRDTIVILDDSNTVLELDRNGSLLTTIDITAADPVKNAGITIAPASNGSGARNYYLVDRGLDNNSHPTENDGLMYEMAVDLDPITNRPPAVNAGADQMIDRPETANLMGAISDDGQPNGSVAATWSVVPTLPTPGVPPPGTGTVTFGNPNAANTTATFSATGRYTLRLTADDGGLTGFDEMTVDVYAVGGVRMVQIPISHGADDAFEITTNAFGNENFVDLSSADDELGNDGPSANSPNETVMTGLRFTNLPVPAGGEIMSAKIQFKTDEVGTDAAAFTIRGEAADNAAQYVGGKSGNIRARVSTTATASWNPPAWSLIGEAGVNQQTPELKGIMQEIIDRPGWAKGNAVGFMIDGTGRRTAEAKDGLTAPVLLLQFRLEKGGPVNAAPTANAGLDSSIQLPNSATLDGTVTDDAMPDPPATTTATWSKVSGPGTVTFGNANNIDTTASFSAAGTYVLRLTANDSERQTTDDVTVQVTAAAVAVNLTMTANPTSVTVPGQTTLSGNLRRTNGTGVTNRPIEIWRQPTGEAATLLRTITTASGGSFSTTHRPTTQTTYWAVHAATTQFSAAQSPNRTVTVRPRVTAALSRTTAAPGQAVFVRGVHEPGGGGTEIRLQRREGTSNWVLAQTRTLTGTQTSYEFEVTRQQTGTFRFRTFVPAQNGRQAVTVPSGNTGLVLTVRN